MFKIKEEFLDSKVSDPYTGKDTYIRFLDKNMYIYYVPYYDWMFEYVSSDQEVVLTSKNKNK